LFISSVLTFGQCELSPAQLTQFAKTTDYVRRIRSTFEEKQTWKYSLARLDKHFIKEGVGRMNFHVNPTANTLARQHIFSSKNQQLYFDFKHELKKVEQLST
jgi:hypothetical protein